MTRDEIIDMAREQSLLETTTEGVFIVNTDDLGRMLAAEREACAKVIEHLPTQQNFYVRHLCAAAIRARSAA